LPGVLARAPRLSGVARVRDAAQAEAA